MPIVHVEDANFKKEVLDEKITVLADFYADWCQPCKMVAPIIEQLSKEYEGKLKVVKIDVEKAPSTASQFGVMSIPALIFFKEGKVHDQVVGALGKAQLKSKIEENLNG